MIRITLSKFETLKELIKNLEKTVPEVVGEIKIVEKLWN